VSYEETVIMDIQIVYTDISTEQNTVKRTTTDIVCVEMCPQFTGAAYKACTSKNRSIEHSERNVHGVKPKYRKCQ